MKNVIQMGVTVLALLTASMVFAAELDAATRQDISRHRAMAQAHENAAKCLDAGKSDEQCEKQLLLECKGLGIGKFCGMKHTH
jgi:F0F1-type ATP synthase gamma subunit